jgi:hypothetical protein
MSSNDEEEEVVFCEFISRPEGKPIFKLILVIIVIIVLFFVIILISANTDVIWLVIKIICLIIFYVSIVYVIIWYKKRKILQGEGIVCEEEGQQIIINITGSEKPKTVKTAVKPITTTKKETKKIGKKEQQGGPEIPPSEAEVKYDVNFFQGGLICYALSAIGIFCCLDAFTDKIDQLTGGNIGVKFNNTEQIFQFLEGNGKDDFFKNYESSWELLKRRTNFDLSLNLMFFTIKELYYYGNAKYRDNLKQVFKSVTGKDCFENIKDVLLNSMKILREDPEDVRKEIKDVMKFFPTLVQLFTEGKITCGNINDSLYLLTSFLINTYSIHEISSFFASLKRNEPEILFEVQFQTEEDLKQRGVQDFLANGGSFAALYNRHKKYLKSPGDKGGRLAEEVNDGYYYLFGFTAFSSGVLESDQQKAKRESEQKLKDLYKKLRY